MLPTPHCDPAQGVFETLLVVGGRPIELDAHLKRLGGSLAALFGAALPDEAAAIALERVRGVALGRLRLTASPDRRGRLTVAAEAGDLDPERAFPRLRTAVALRSVQVDGGFGCHKWIDRRLLDQAEAESAPGAVPLLLDSDGAALEASRANVFALIAGVLETPPTDGRIVPGIARRRVIELARAAGRRVREANLSLEQLRDAEEVFLTNSVRGIEPVSAIDGDQLEGDGTASAGLAAALRREWAGPAGRAAASAGAP